MLPDPFDVPAAWYGRDISKKQKLWSYEFNLNEISELENASKAFYDAGLPLGLITSDNFPLPNLGEVVKRVQKELRDGIGFTLFRGLPVDRYDQKMLATMFCGIGSHIGLARSQNAAGHLLGHVRNIGADLSDPRTRVTKLLQDSTFTQTVQMLLGFYVSTKLNQAVRLYWLRALPFSMK